MPRGNAEHYRIFLEHILRTIQYKEMKSLPPLPSLQALDAVARLGSAHAAAEALSVTASAITHRLRALEASLGYRVVAPRGRGLTLTPKAEALVRDLSPALATLGAVFETATQDRAEGPLRVSAPPGFASAWLCPRIGRFQADNRGVSLTLASSGADADVEIRFTETGAGEAVYLARPEFFPICAPALAHAAGGLRRPSDLSDLPLLHLFDRSDWSGWIEAAGAPKALTGAAPARDVVFEDANLLLSAALAGQGVALGDAITCARYLEEGALIRPFAPTSRSKRAYFLDLRRETGAARAFADWLRRELNA